MRTVAAGIAIDLDVPFWAHAAGTRCFDLEARERGREP